MGFACWVPPDNEELAEFYHAKGGGVCGPASIAAEIGMTVREVLEHWKGVGPTAFRGFSPVADMRATLVALGYSFTYRRGGKGKVFPTPNARAAILRIQWLQEDGTEYFWREAGPHSHYVLMKLLDDGWWVYCNGDGWFRRDSELASRYLPGRGFVSSYLELSPTH